MSLFAQAQWPVQRDRCRLELLTAQAREQRRNVERPEAIMLEPADIGVEKGAQIRHPVFEHGDAIDADAPGKALVDFGIEPAIA